jgi:demethylmenaquinone methyltransferase/2-methoxy-6-polyprenyl-1,4-benzoquinol methylase
MTTPDKPPTTREDRGRQVRRIFSEIAPRYDLLNHVLSLNIDRRWRRQAVDQLLGNTVAEGLYLDVCAGTFDLTLELAGRPGFRGHVVALDFALPMLLRGRPKLAGVKAAALCADSLVLPFPDGAFQGAMVAFGLRNLASLERGVAELFRVLGPDGKLVVLEFTLPPNRLLRALYLTYFDRVLPWVGRVVSGHRWAYTYLPESVREFPGPAELERRIAAAGFCETGFRLLSGGIAALHWGRRWATRRASGVTG